MMEDGCVGQWIDRKKKMSGLLNTLVWMCIEMLECHTCNYACFHFYRITNLCFLIEPKKFSSKIKISNLTKHKLKNRIQHRETLPIGLDAQINYYKSIITKNNIEKEK